MTHYNIIISLFLSNSILQNENLCFYIRPHVHPYTYVHMHAHTHGYVFISQSTTFLSQKEIQFQIMPVEHNL